jgi:hypothetical protein
MMPVFKRLLASPWFDLLASPLVWSLHFLASYGVVEFACEARFLDSHILGLSLLSAIVLALTLLAGLATLYVGLAAYKRWRAMIGPVNGSGALPQNDQARRFMALSGVLLSALFGLTILVTGLPALVLRPCGP